MADDSGESKTHEPTEQKLRKSREEGNSLFVTQINTAVSLASFFILVFLILGLIVNLYSQVFNKSIIYASLPSHLILKILVPVLSQLGLAIFVVASIFMFLAFVTSLIQLKGIRFIPLKIKVETFNIIENAKQKFSGKNLIKLALDVTFICIFLLIGAILCLNNINSINNSIYLFFADQLLFMKYLFVRIIFLTTASLFIFIVIVYAVERRNYMKNLMMTREELKKEIEDNEGKAEVKSRIHELRQELLADEEYMDKLAKDMGSFVVSNPTHYGILLAYTPTSLPIVLIKGKNEKAKDIIRISKKVGLPVIENKFVARTLYELANPGERIPRILIKDIGEIIGRNFLQIQPFIRKDEVFKPKDPTSPLFNLQKAQQNAPT